MISPRPEFFRGRKRRFLRRIGPMLACQIEMLEPRRLLSAPTQWYTAGIGGGGALYTPALSPFNTGEVWLPTDMSELFHTTNMGAAWTYPNFNQIQGDPSVDVQYTSNPQILYSINALSTYPDVPPDSLSESTNAGASWTALPGWNTNNIPYSLYANPNSTTQLIASDGTNLYWSSDGGQTFSIVYTAASAGTLFCAGAYFTGSDIFVGTNQGLVESTNGGSSFSLASVSGIPSGQAMLSFAGSTAGATTRFFCVTVPSSDLAPGVPNYSVAYDYTGIYSLNFGQSKWAAASTGISSSDYPDFISMTAGDINDVYAAGTDTPDLDYPTVYKTTNAGAGWTMDFQTVNNVNINTAWEGQGGDNNWGFGGCAFGLEVSPVNVNIVVMSDEDGCYDTTNGGATWTQMFVNPADSNPAGKNTPKHKVYHSVGMNQTSVWDITWSSATNLFASFTDITGIHSTDGGVGWDFPNYGSVLQNTIYQSVVGPTGILYAADSSVHDLFQSDQLQNGPIDSGTGAVIMSTDGGADWTMLHNFNHPVDDILLDPNVANRAYALVVNSTSGGIFVTNNLNAGASSTWTQLTDPPGTAGHPWDMQILKNGTLLVTYSAQYGSNGFTDTSGIFTSTNAGSSWTNVSYVNMDYYTKDVIVAPWDSTQETWYVTVDNGWGGHGNNEGGIYETTNGGKHWTWIFDQDGVDSLTINPATDEMYIATVTNGLWYSADADLASPTFSELAAYPFHQPEGIFIDPYNSNEIWVTSFGGGLMVGYTVAPSVASQNIFYFGSTGFDDGDTTANPTVDAGAIATDKSALLPGQTAAFANVTSYFDGINGIMVDLADGPPAQLSLADFSFAAGTSNTPGSWAAAPAPKSMTVVPGGGVNGSERVEFVWANNVIQNEWLQVTVAADSDTGLANPYVFYFGNMMGATGATLMTNSHGTFLRVGPGDVTGTELAVGPTDVAITSLYDFARGGRVTPGDVSYVEDEVSPTGLLLISPPVLPAGVEQAGTLSMAAASSTNISTATAPATPGDPPLAATSATAAAPATPADPPFKACAQISGGRVEWRGAGPSSGRKPGRGRPGSTCAPNIYQYSPIIGHTSFKAAAPILLPLPGPIAAFVAAEPSPWLQSLDIVLGPMLEFRILA